MSKHLLFHSSVDGYECHSGGLQEILSKSSINFDVVCLSVTSQQSDHVFPKNGTLITSFFFLRIFFLENQVTWHGRENKPQPRHS